MGTRRSTTFAPLIGSCHRGIEASPAAIGGPIARTRSDVQTTCRPIGAYPRWGRSPPCRRDVEAGSGRRSDDRLHLVRRPGQQPHVPRRRDAQNRPATRRFQLLPTRRGSATHGRPRPSDQHERTQRRQLSSASPAEHRSRSRSSSSSRWRSVTLHVLPNSHRP